MVFSALLLASDCGESRSGPTVHDSEEAPDSISGTLDPTRKLTSAIARPCSDELFFIDVPFGVDVGPTVSFNGSQSVNDALADAVSERTRSQWFCAEQDCEASVGRRLLKRRSKSALRRRSVASRPAVQASVRTSKNRIVPFWAALGRNRKTRATLNRASLPAKGAWYQLLVIEMQ